MIALEDLGVDMLTARSGAAAHVLAVADDPNSSSVDLARAIGTDPALTSRTLALANSAYYGLSRRVATTEFAVAVVGFTTVRALALTLAAGLDGADAVPDGFWEQATTAATAASLVGPMLGAPSADAFCVGLLHTLGTALLHKVAPPAALCLPDPPDCAAFERAEIETYGIGHADLAARALASWHFPAPMCAVIAEHHNDVLPDADPMTRTLQVSRVLTTLLLDDVEDCAPLNVELLRLSQGRLGSAHAGAVDRQQIDPLLRQIQTKAAALQLGLTTS